MKNRPDKQRPIDRIRESAGSISIDTPDDKSPLREMISTGDRLFAVKDHAIYEIAFADQIDPERTNPSVPNTLQKTLSCGAADPWVGAVVLTAHGLFLSNSFDPNVGKRAFDIVLDIAQDIAGGHRICQTHQEVEAGALAQANLQIGRDGALVLPAVGSVTTTCNEFLQRADHAVRGLLQLVRLFYPSVGPGGWESLKKEIQSGPQGIDNFLQFVNDCSEFLKLIRNCRNCVEHPFPHQRIVVSDFRIDPNAGLVPPTIEVIHPKTPIPTKLVLDFFRSTMDSLVTIVELMVVFVAARNVRATGAFPVRVMELTPEARRHPQVRYCFGVAIGDEIVPLT